MESFVSNRITEIKKEFLSLPEVIRIQELEKYIDNNASINNKLNELKEKQKQMVNAKEYNQLNQYKIYLDEYNNLKSELLDLPFVEEYLELLEIVNEKLTGLTNEIEYKLNKAINGTRN